jgi:hypothetical protein
MIERQCQGWGALHGLSTVPLDFRDACVPGFEGRDEVTDLDAGDHTRSSPGERHRVRGRWQ